MPRDQWEEPSPRMHARRWLYTGKVEELREREDVVGLLAVAHFLQLSALEKWTAKLLSRKLLGAVRAGEWAVADAWGAEAMAGVTAAVLDASSELRSACAAWVGARLGAAPSVAAPHRALLEAPLLHLLQTHCLGGAEP